MSTSNCPTDNDLAAWCDQRLRGETKDVITAHLVSCPSCRSVAIWVCGAIERQELADVNGERLAAVVALLRAA